jgi:CubicO group peptidase (beta-lactamase class C family)
MPGDATLVDEIGALAAQERFSGVVRVDRDGATVFEQAYGFAHRAHHIPNRLDTQFGTASAVKGLTALVVVDLVVDGKLDFDTTARSLLGDDLPLVDDGVTVEHLLAHRSGIGDYVDEEQEGEIDDYVLPVPVHQLVDTEDYLRVLDGFPTKFAPGTRFSYCNGGFVVLALLAERAAGLPFHQLVATRVCEPAGMVDTGFLRSDRLPARAALGYLDPDGDRTNVLHLPVRGSGDGGIFTTAADVAAFWTALFAGRIVPGEWVTEMTRERSDVPEDGMRYGLGFWLGPTDDSVILTGYDAGASFWTSHRPSTGETRVVLANSSEGAWPLVRRLQSDT